MGKDENEGKGRKFKVVDRRRFTVEGEARADDHEEESSPTPEPARAPRDDKPVGGSEETPAESGSETAVEFMSFVASLATNAMGALGALPPGYGPPGPEDPEIARHYIEVLAMLQVKTKGNLSGQEEQSFQRILAELRMAYVQKTQSPPKP